MSKAKSMKSFAIIFFVISLVSVSLAEPQQFIPHMPATMQFAGQNIPLERAVVFEQFDAMMTILALDNKGQLIVWWKRGARFLPTVKGIFKNAGLPEDLAYLAVAESDLLGRAKSPAGAYGFWQFMPKTGKDNGMAVSEGWDERGDFVRATMAAAGYLKELHEEFGDWFLAMAAYNAGPGNIRKMLKAEHAKSYWDAVPIAETFTYVPRIVLIKHFFENPRAFGFDPTGVEVYPEASKTMARITFQLSHATTFATICDWIETDYRTMLLLNPQVGRKNYTMDATLPAGRALFLDLPKDKMERFKTALDAHNNR